MWILNMSSIKTMYSETSGMAYVREKTQNDDAPQKE